MSDASMRISSRQKREGQGPSDWEMESEEEGRIGSE